MHGTPSISLAVTCPCTLPDIMHSIQQGASLTLVVCGDVGCTRFCLTLGKHPGSGYTQMLRNNGQCCACLYPLTTKHVYITLS